MEYPLPVVLQEAQNPSLEIRNRAEAYLNHFADTKYEECFIELCKVFGNEGLDVSIRQLSGIYLKNMITAKDDNLAETKAARWNNWKHEIKEEAKKLLLQNINSPIPLVCHTAAQVLAAYGAVDVPQQAWPNLLPHLFGYINNKQFSDCCKTASLEALGYMCEVMIPDNVDSAVVNQILSSIVEGMKSENSYDIRLAAVTALNNSLDFTSKNFEVESERNHILTAVCIATQAPEPKVRERAFECCSTIAELYYDKLAPYAEQLFNVSVNAIQKDEPTVGMQAIEFWNVICDQEENLIQDIEEEIETPDKLLKLTSSAAKILVPLVLQCMTKQDEDDDDDDSWNIAKAAATLLEGISRTIRNEVLDIVLPFVHAHINSPDWRFKEAAILSFGMILEGPEVDKLMGWVGPAIPILIPCLKDPKPLVRDTTAWTIGRICELFKSAITQETLDPLVRGLLGALDDQVTSVVSQACYALYNFAESCYDESEASSNALSQYMFEIVAKLMGIANRTDEEYKKIRSASYETINKMVENSALDMAPMLMKLLEEILLRINRTFDAHAQMDANERYETQSALCGVAGEIIKKLDWSLFQQPHIDGIMQTLLLVLKTPSPVAHEEAFIAVGYVIQKMGENFTRFLPFLIEALYGGLLNLEAYSLCTVAIGVVGDLCRALNQQILPYCDTIMQHLLTLLQSPVVHRSVKPHVISVFADIAMAIESEFDRYNNIVLGVLKQAGEVKVTDDDDEDLIEYINTLRNSILEAYTGIVQGLKPTNSFDIFRTYIPNIFQFLRLSTEDPHRSGEVLKSAIGLVGDLGQAFGGALKDMYSQPFIHDLIREGLQNGSDTSEVASWAQKVVMSVLNSK